MQRPVRVLMLGGGYTAIGLVRAMRRAIERGQVELTVVSRENYHVFHGFVPEMITGRIGIGQILSPARRVFRPARLHVGEIESVDFERKVVVTSRHLDGRTTELEYDQIIFGLGSADNLDAYPGLAEHAFRLRTYDDCFRLRNHILTMLELAEIEHDVPERQRLLTFFVAGGGYAGSELAAELAEHLRSLTRRDYPQLTDDAWRVVLVHPGPTILPELYGSRGQTGNGQGFPKLVKYATDHIRKLGVEIKTGTRVAWATPNEVGLSNGERIPTRTIISAVGSRPPALLDALPLPRSESGRVQTDDRLRVPGFDHVWAAGDCASAPHPQGGTCPPVAIYAIEQGKTVARNILRSIEGQPLQPFRFGGLGQGVAIGRRTAVAEVKGRELRGLPAWVIGRGLLLSYVPSRERRVRMLFDWFLGRVVGRDVVELSVADNDDYEISHHIFQPGEVIVEKGQVGRYVYLITEGEVELVQPGESETVAAATLGPGDHFGHVSRDRKIHDTVRARSLVRAVTVKVDQADRLRRVLSPLDGVSAD